MLAHYSLGEFAIYIPFEKFLNESEGEMEKIFHDVQTSSDVTYFLTFALRFIGKEFDKMLDSLAEYSTKVIKDDFYQLDEEEKTDQISLFSNEPEPVKEEVTPVTPNFEPVVVQPEPVEVNPQPIVEEPKVEPNLDEEEFVPIRKN